MPPDVLGADARAEWDRIVAQLHAKRLIAQVDLAVVATYCTLYGRLVQIQRLLAAPKLKAGSKKWVGFAKLERQTAALLRPYLVELGLSPGSRGKVRPLAEEPATPKADDFDSIVARVTGKVVPIGSRAQ